MRHTLSQALQSLTSAIAVDGSAYAPPVSVNFDVGTTERVVCHTLRHLGKALKDLGCQSIYGWGGVVPHVHEPTTSRDTPGDPVRPNGGNRIPGP